MSAKSRRTDFICAVGAVIMVIVTLVVMCGGGTFIQAAALEMPYESKLFSTDKVHQIDIVANESDWQNMLDNATAEEYISCTVVIDGEKYANVAIRPKGNSSLSTVASSDSDRYSFKIEFDHYDKNSNYYGLDKLCLNNAIQDNTYMKDYISYQMMNYLGTDAPLSSFVWITVNGSDWGLYTAVEGVEDAFAERNYGTNHGQIYKPDSMDMGGGGRGAEKGNNGAAMPDMKNFISDSDFDFDSVKEFLVEKGIDETAIDELIEGDVDFNEIREFLAENGVDMQDIMEVVSGNGDNAPEIPSGDNAPEMPSGDNAPEMPSGDNAPEMPSGDNAPEMPSGDNAPEMPSGDNAPEMPSGDNAREMPSGDNAPEMPSGDNAPEMPSGDNAPEMPSGDNTPEMPSGDEDTEADKTEGFDKKNFGGMGGFGAMGGSDDVLLVYSDDDPESYPNIFDNAVFDDVSDADKSRLIAALKSLNKGDIESSVNIDEVLRYFAVHNFVLNEDSYTGSITHNYYLQEQDGILSMIAWDYNLAFGGMGMGGGSGATSYVNSPIDSPVTSGDISDRPMVSWIFNSEEYTEQYHEVMNELITGLFESGEFESMIDNAIELISPYVEKDPTAFCTYEEFEKGAQTLKEFCLRRAESIRGQLDGTIPSTSEGQSADKSNFVDASDLNISDMGTQNSGMGGGRDFGGNNRDFDKQNDDTENAAPDTEQKNFPGGMDFPGGGEMSGEASSGMQTWILLACSVLVLLGGLIFAKFYK